MIDDIGRSFRHALCAAILLGWSIAAPAIETGMRSGAVVELRYRYENVDDTAFARDAHANTLRLRLGYRWLFAPGWQLYADAEHVQPLFGEHFNSTANGRSWYPVVADPESSEVNQAFIEWSDDASAATLGRQRVQLDNQRFFGNSGWRQNEQTFDALSLRHAFEGNGPAVHYLYLDRVLRVNGHDNPDPLLARWRLHGHLLHLDQALPLGRLAGYAYLVDNRDIATLSTQTYGARWSGTQPIGDVTLGWTFEYARQSDWADNPLAQDASYRLFEPSLKWRGITFKAGQEVLGGNGRYGFATPYATLHAFNGWADRFTSTPKDGLDDRYVSAAGAVGRGFSWAMAWHDFRADRGSYAYGREMDASIGYAFDTHWSALLKLADYRADGYSTDERKLWASIEYRY